MNYENTWNNCKKDYSKNLVDTDNLNNDLANAKARILEANERTFQGFVKCPHCGETFASDQAAYDNFNKHKTNDITYWQNKVSEIEIKIIEMTKSRDKIANMGKESKAQIDELISQISEYDSKIETIKSQINDTYGIQVDYTEVQKLDQEIQTLNNKAIDCGKYNNELNQIQAAIDKTILDSKQANAEELDKLENEVDEIKSSLEEEYIKKSKWASKAKYQQQLHEYNNKLNDIEYELELVSDFMQTMISMINAKAKDITGIDCVMLEENLGNDNLKEVCYATVDGVPFDSVNTSQKLEVGIKFIERIKKILGENQLPILADRLEGFDSVNTIKALTSEQLICTRVGSDDMQNITII